MKNDIHAIITQNIIDAIESGKTTSDLPWRQLSSYPIKLSDGSAYRGVNVLNLCAASMVKGYSSPVWGGFHAWRSAGGSVRRGEKASIVVFSRILDTENKRTGEIETISRSGSRRVFNRDQIEGLPEIEVPSLNPTIKCMIATDVMSDIVKKNCATVKHQGQNAYYLPSSDIITMPYREIFTGTATQSADVGYASTLGHELVHFTGHSSRLNRNFGNGMRSTEYQNEELVAELGSAFLCAELGFQYAGVEDHAGYLEYWLDQLKEDNRALFKAAGAASAAVNWLLNRETIVDIGDTEKAHVFA